MTAYPAGGPPGVVANFPTVYQIGSPPWGPMHLQPQAVACALQNLALSATAAGLGSFWSSPPLTYNQAFNDWLGIRAEDRCAGLIYLGWPKSGAAPPKSSRAPITKKVTFADA